MDPQPLEKYGRTKLAVAMAEWLAFQMSVWHEIATWYGYASIAAWPEKISAFSPEDLYSNLLGIKITGGIIFTYGASSDSEYNRNMDAWLQRILERLEAVPQKQGQAAMMSVDGIWWDSGKRIPEWRLVMRRNMDVGTEIHPWLVTLATDGDRRRGRPFKDCAGEIDALVLRSPDSFEGTHFRDYASIEFEVDDLLIGQGFPIPRPQSRVVTQQDFPSIIAAIRRANAEEFGDAADRP